MHRSWEKLSDFSGLVQRVWFDRARSFPLNLSGLTLLVSTQHTGVIARSILMRGQQAGRGWGHAEGTVLGAFWHKVVREGRQCRPWFSQGSSLSLPGSACPSVGQPLSKNGHLKGPQMGHLSQALAPCRSPFASCHPRVRVSELAVFPKPNPH